MEIIIRASGERTESKCIKLTENQGNVNVIRAFPFGESIRQTYLKAIELKQEFIPVIDADVLIYPHAIQAGIDDIKKASLTQKIFCLDGKTNDKIFMKNRRAGIHIYKTELLETALQFIDNDHIKPETNVRNNMADLGYKTHVGDIVYGMHDFEQYYKDLWRKAVCQTEKLKKMLKKKPEKWKKLAKTDNDFLVIYNAHVYGNKFVKDIKIDARMDFDAEKQIKILGLEEKDPL